MSSRRSERSERVSGSSLQVAISTQRVDPDTRGLRPLLRDDRALLRDDNDASIECESLRRQGVGPANRTSERIVSRMRGYYVYILASHSRCLYVGVTNDLRRRTWEHQHGVIEGFSSRYRTFKLVHYELTADIAAAITREKQLKRWPRWRKERVIEAGNAEWRDLSVDWFRDVSPPAVHDGRK